MIRFLKDLVEVHLGGNGHELWYRTLFNDLLTPLLRLLAHGFLDLGLLLPRRLHLVKLSSGICVCCVATILCRRSFRTWRRRCLLLVLRFVRFNCSMIDAGLLPFQWRIRLVSFILCIDQVYVNFDLVNVLRQRVAHVAFKLGDGEEELELVVRVWQVSFKHLIREAPNKAALVVCNNLCVVVLEELSFEVGEIESAIVVRGKLVCDVDYDFVCVESRHERVSHGLTNLVHLLVRRYEFIEAQRSMRVN